MRIRDLKVGQWVRVIYTDIGARDGIVVEKFVGFGSEARVFFPDHNSMDIIEGSQVLKAGRLLEATSTGLNS